MLDHMDEDDWDGDPSHDPDRIISLARTLVRAMLNITEEDELCEDCAYSAVLSEMVYYWLWHLRDQDYSLDASVNTVRQMTEAAVNRLIREAEGVDNPRTELH